MNRAALDELATIDRSALDVTMRGTLDVLEAIARRAIAELDQRTDRLRAAAHFFGPGQTLAEIASMQATDTPERLDRYEARLRAVPAYLDAWGDVAREGIADGVTSPRAGDGASGGAARPAAVARRRRTRRRSRRSRRTPTRRSGSRASSATP